jgi:hypothetical protein
MRNEIAVVNNTAGYAPALANGNVELSQGFSVPVGFLKGANVVNVVHAAGTGSAVIITFGGTFGLADTAKIVIESNLTSRQKFVKAYTVTITSDLIGATAAATRTNVANAFKNKFLREINAGLLDYPISTAVVSGAANNVLTITQKGKAQAGISGSGYSDGAGTLVKTSVAFVPSNGTAADLKLKGIKASDITSASYDTVKIDLSIDAAIPFIDSKGVIVKELYLFVVAGRGAATKTAIDAF